MRNQFVGDFGDYAKYSLLRALAGGRTLGVAWYLRPDVAIERNGGFTGYLDQPRVWEHFNPELFWRLRYLLCRGFRSVAAVERSGLLPVNTRFANTILDPDSRQRAEWFEQAVECLTDCNFVYADPDIGLLNVQWTRNPDRIPIGEAHQLAEGRPAVIYHHGQIGDWMNRLHGCTHAFLCRRFTTRTFFMLNADDAMIADLEVFVCRWRQAEQRAGFEPHELSRLIRRAD